ncbi:MAG: hypothetical protein ACMUEL_02025 [Flavobacteriales bacterium Tduv]
MMFIKIFLGYVPIFKIMQKEIRKIERIKYSSTSETTFQLITLFHGTLVFEGQ